MYLNMEKQIMVRQLTIHEWKAYGHDLLDALVKRGHNRTSLYKWLQRRTPGQSAHFAEMNTVDECKRAVLVLEARLKKMDKKKKNVLKNKTLPIAEQKKAFEALKTWTPPVKPKWREVKDYIARWLLHI